MLKTSQLVPPQPFTHHFLDPTIQSSWAHNSDKSTEFRFGHMGSYIQLSALVTEGLCPILPLPPRHAETSAHKNTVQQRKKEREGKVSCHGASVIKISPSPMRKSDSRHQAFVVWSLLEKALFKTWRNGVTQALLSQKTSCWNEAYSSWILKLGSCTYSGP